MTVRVSKPEFNLREKITELDKPTGLKGNELMRSDSSQDARDLISAGRKNLIINGAMRIAQRGTSSTSVGYQTIDRQNAYSSGTDETPTQAQVDVSSGTGPYNEGFRKALRYTNGNQTSGAQAGSRVLPQYKFEAQDLVNSGWNYKSSSSFITLSFWVKSSVAQTYYGYFRSQDGTDQIYTYSETLSANTWTKVVKTIPGNSNIQLDNDNGEGIQWNILIPFVGTSYTDSGVSLNTWNTYASGTRTPDYNTTWYTTNDATFEYTGLQAEVGRNATEFEHRPYAEELKLCERYYEVHWQNHNPNNPAGAHNDGYNAIAAGGVSGSKAYFPFKFRTQKRASPTISYSGKFRISGGGGAGTNKIPDEFYSPGIDGGRLRFPQSGGSNGDGMWLEFDGANSTSGYISVSAEL